MFLNEGRSYLFGEKTVDLNGCGSDYAFILSDDSASSTKFGEFTLKSVNSANFLAELTKSLSTLAAESVQNTDGFSVNGKFYNIESSNSYSVNSLAAAIQNEIGK